MISGYKVREVQGPIVVEVIGGQERRCFGDGGTEVDLASRPTVAEASEDCLAGYQKVTQRDEQSMAATCCEDGKWT